MIEETIKCKNCGATIDLSKAKDGVVECEYCGSIFTIPKKETSTEALSFLHQGEHDLDTCRFDDAYTAYSKAAEYDSNEPEAYFGMSLAEFKVQYIKDKIIKKDEITKKIKTTDHLQPICYSFIEKEFSKNKNYLHALELATDKQKTEYEKKAKEIDDIRKKFIELKESGLDFDTFICVKVSKLDDEQTDSSRKNWTQDAYNADSIYDLLKREGYSPFFSEREVKGRTGVDYEALILYALYTSETMLVVCSNEEYLNTPWVKNEYTRFKELVNNKDKENDSLTIVFDGTPIERLPGSIGKIQGIDYSRRAADFEIVNFVKNHTPLARAKREEERRKKEEEAEQFRKQIEEQKKVQQDLEKKINNLNTSNVNGGTSTIGTLLTRANQEMEVRNFTKAEKFFETVLERAPENGEAWWGKFLCDFKVLSEDEILNIINDQTLKNV
ncbi:MAG TPA: hypothetical protein DCY93_01025, partial [Firmicutes bacterium]|nr:hypothetical protein [Bacillota bacterium]